MPKTPIPSGLLKKNSKGKVHRYSGEITPLEVPTEHMPQPPADMNERAKELWQCYAKVLYPLGLLTSLDVGIFRMFVESIDRYERAGQMLSEEGLVIEGVNGVKRHPAVAMQNQAMKSIERLAKQFGLTPSARASLEIAGHEAPSDQEKGEFVLDMKLHNKQEGGEG